MKKKIKVQINRNNFNYFCVTLYWFNFILKNNVILNFKEIYFNRIIINYISQ